MKTPFTPNKTRKQTNLAAQKKVLDAIKALGIAKSSASNWSEYETIGYFQFQLQEFLANDNGEAGLTPYIEKK